MLLILRIPIKKTARIPVSVEDVSSFISLAQDKAGIKQEEQLTEIFLRLSKAVHPLALGNVHRNYSLIRSYMISRKEAKNNIKLNVTEPSQQLEKAIWDLYENYEQDLQLLEPFNPSLLLNEQEQQVDFEATGGIIESLGKIDAFIFEGRIVRQIRPTPDLPPVNMEIVRQRWKHIKPR